LAGEGRAHQLGNSWTGQVAAAGDAAPAIPGAYWGCRFYVLGGVPAPEHVRLRPSVAEGRYGPARRAALRLHFAKGVERYATGNYGILENDPGAQGRSQRPTHSRMSPSATP
jgi:hypothetical protein